MISKSKVPSFWSRKESNKAQTAWNLSKKKLALQNKPLSTLISSWFICFTRKKAFTIKISFQKLILSSLCIRLSYWLMPLANLRLPFFWNFKTKFRVWVMMSFKASLKTKMFRPQKTSSARFKSTLLMQSMNYLQN